MTEANSTVYASGTESMIDIAYKYTGDANNAQAIIDFNWGQGEGKPDITDWLTRGEWIAIPNRLLIAPVSQGGSPSAGRASNQTVVITGHGGASVPVVNVTAPRSNWKLYALAGGIALLAFALILSDSEPARKR